MVGIWVDSDNRVILSSKNTGKQRVFVTIAGTVVHTFDPGTIDAYPNKWKIAISVANLIEVSYWSGSAWILFTSYTGDIGTTKKGFFSFTNSNGDDVALNFDNYYLTDEDYLTETP